MLKEADSDGYSNRDLLKLRGVNYGEFFRLRQSLIREECMLKYNGSDVSVPKTGRPGTKPEAGKLDTNTPEPDPRKTLESYDGYSFKISEERPLLSKIYSSFRPAARQMTPVLVGAGVFGGMTALMAVLSGGPVYPDAVIISSGIGGIIGHVIADQDRKIKIMERTNKLFVSTQE